MSIVMGFSLRVIHNFYCIIPLKLVFAQFHLGTTGSIVQALVNR